MTVKELIQELESRGYDDEEVLIDGEDIEEVFAEHDGYVYLNTYREANRRKESEEEDRYNKSIDYDPWEDLDI